VEVLDHQPLLPEARSTRATHDRSAGVLPIGSVSVSRSPPALPLAPRSSLALPTMTFPRSPLPERSSWPSIWRGRRRESRRGRRALRVPRGRRTRGYCRPGTAPRSCPRRRAGWPVATRADWRALVPKCLAQQHALRRRKPKTVALAANSADGETRTRTGDTTIFSGALRVRAVSCYLAKRLQISQFCSRTRLAEFGSFRSGVFAECLQL
jgi:hypothetical protein